MPRARAVAIALRRQRDPTPLPPWLILLAALAAGVAVAQAQAPVPLLPPGAGGEQAAPVGPPPVENPDIPGATKSRASPDPGMMVAPPSMGGTMSVIPPPGLEGGNQPVITGNNPKGAS